MINTLGRPAVRVMYQPIVSREHLQMFAVLHTLKRHRPTIVSFYPVLDNIFQILQGNPVPFFLSFLICIHIKEITSLSCRATV